MSNALDQVEEWADEVFAAQGKTTTWSLYQQRSQAKDRSDQAGCTPVETVLTDLSLKKPVPGNGVYRLFKPALEITKADVEEALLSGGVDEQGSGSSGDGTHDACDGGCETEDEDSYDEGVEYWQKRYLNEPKPSDWILKYQDLREILNTVTGGRRDLRILHAGCGNSLLPEEMYDDGYSKSVNIDTSSVVIEQMRDRNGKQRPDMEYLVMDATAPRFSVGSFDLVFDKALLDTLLCEDDAESLIATYFEEMALLTAGGGMMVLVTYGPPEDRMHRVPKKLFDVEMIAVPAKGKNKITGFHYVYVLRRKVDVGVQAAARSSCEVLA